MTVQALNQSAFGKECSRPIAIQAEIRGGGTKIPLFGRRQLSHSNIHISHLPIILTQCLNNSIFKKITYHCIILLPPPQCGSCKGKDIDSSMRMATVTDYSSIKFKLSHETL